MTTITITVDLHPEAADEAHETGVSERTFDRIQDFFIGIGDDVRIEKVDNE